jgi:hypothetical protein
MKEQGIIPHLVAELNTPSLSSWERDGVRVRRIANLRALGHGE